MNPPTSFDGGSHGEGLSAGARGFGQSTGAGSSVGIAWEGESKGRVRGREREREKVCLFTLVRRIANNK